MAQELTEEAIEKLKTQQVIWFGSVRPDGRPHLVPIWFVWLDGHIYVSTEPESVKSRNLQANPQVSLALEDGTHPVICEGDARIVAPPYTLEIKNAFFEKYEWVLENEKQYNALIEVTPERWLIW